MGFVADHTFALELLRATAWIVPAGDRSVHIAPAIGVPLCRPEFDEKLRMSRDRGTAATTEIDRRR